jgi:hypothetical protein
MSRGRRVPPRFLQPFGLIQPPFGRLVASRRETVRPPTDPRAASQIEAIERELDALREKIDRAAHQYATAAGNRADGEKERALRALFGEPKPHRGRRFDDRQMAIDYERLRRQPGDLIFELRRIGRESVLWIAERCPRNREEALEGVAWLHDAANGRAVAQTLRRFASDLASEIDERKKINVDYVDRLENVLAQLRTDFLGRKSSKALLKPALRQVSGNK